MALSQEVLLFSIFGITVLLLGGFVTIFSVYISQKKVREKEKQLLEAVIQAQESEQMRIGRDLHDEVGPMLTLVMYSIEEHFGASPEVETTIKKAISSVRMVSQNLCPPQIESEGLVYAVSEMCRNFNRISGTTIEFIGPQNIPPLTTSKNIHIYRIISELVNNAVKHSKAKQMHVQLIPQNKKLHIKVADDGIGFPKEKTNNGIGIQNIDTRVKLLNGKKSIISEPGEGTIFTIELPIDGV